MSLTVTATIENNTFRLIQAPIEVSKDIPRIAKAVEFDISKLNGLQRQVLKVITQQTLNRKQSFEATSWIVSRMIEEIAQEKGFSHG